MDDLVTLFGGGGFLGRYVAQELLRLGARVRIVERDPREAYFLKPLGGLGQTQFVAADITKPESVRRAVQGSTAVINLVGILKGRFHDVHVTGARTVAEAAAAASATVRAPVTWTSWKRPLRMPTRLITAVEPCTARRTLSGLVMSAATNWVWPSPPSGFRK